MSAIMFDDKIDVVLDRKELKQRILNTGRCSKCFSCKFINKLKDGLNNQGFLSFNKDVELWKIEYEDTNLKAYPVYKL